MFCWPWSSLTAWAATAALTRGMGVTGVGDADARGVVQVALAVRGDQPGALAAVDDEVRVARPDGRHDRAVGQGSADGGGVRPADVSVVIVLLGADRGGIDGVGPLTPRQHRGEQHEPDRGQEDDGADDVDLHRDAPLLGAVDVQREGRRLAGRERGDDVVVDGQAEREQRRRDDARQDEREGHLPEGRPVVRVQVTRGLLQVAGEAQQPGADRDHHEADVEHHVGDEDAWSCPADTGCPWARTTTGPTR